MKRRWLPPKPEPPPEGYMYYAGNIVTIEDVQLFSIIKIGMNPYSWRNDPTYNMSLTKRPATTKEK